MEKHFEALNHIPYVAPEVDFEKYSILHPAKLSWRCNDRYYFRHHDDGSYFLVIKRGKDDCLLPGMWMPMVFQVAALPESVKVKLVVKR